MSVPEVFQRITAALNHAGIAYMLSGSFASAYYGAPRSTQDIDLVIEATPAQLRAFVQGLPTDEYYVDIDAALEAHKRRSLFNVIDLVTGWKIDLIIRKFRPFSEEEFRRRQQVNLHGTPSFCGECRGHSHLQARMVKSGAIAQADRRCGGNIESAVG